MDLARTNHDHIFGFCETIIINLIDDLRCWCTLTRTPRGRLHKTSSRMMRTGLPLPSSGRAWRKPHSRCLRRARAAFVPPPPPSPSVPRAPPIPPPPTTRKTTCARPFRRPPCRCTAWATSSSSFPKAPPSARADHTQRLTRRRRRRRRRHRRRHRRRRRRPSMRRWPALHR